MNPGANRLKVRRPCLSSRQGPGRVAVAGYRRGRTSLPCRLVPCCRLEVDAGRIGEAEQRADPGRYCVPVSDMSPDQKWQGVVVTEEEFSFKGLRALAEAEWHEQAGLASGDGQQR